MLSDYLGYIQWVYLCITFGVNLCCLSCGRLSIHLWASGTRWHCCFGIVYFLDLSFENGYAIQWVSVWYRSHLFTWLVVDWRTWLIDADWETAVGCHRVGKSVLRGPQWSRVYLAGFHFAQNLVELGQGLLTGIRSLWRWRSWHRSAFKPFVYLRWFRICVPGSTLEYRCLVPSMTIIAERTVVGPASRLKWCQVHNISGWGSAVIRLLPSPHSFRSYTAAGALIVGALRISGSAWANAASSDAVGVSAQLILSIDAWHVAPVEFEVTTLE